MLLGILVCETSMKDQKKKKIWSNICFIEYLIDVFYFFVIALKYVALME